MLSCTAFCPNIAFAVHLPVRGQGPERLRATLGGGLIGGGNDAPGTRLHYAEPDSADLDVVPDLVFAPSKFVVFIDGNFWHGYRYPV